ncbi:AdoMet_MTases domain containing protein [actinobacterium SCGC AAA044-D11]
MPIANGFHSSIHFDPYRYELVTSFCNDCKLFQIVNQPEKELMFHDSYPFFTGLSKSMTDHFWQLVDDSVLPLVHAVTDPFILEIGSNDGTLLQRIKAKGIRHLGVDPSANVVDRAISNGINSLNVFFGEEAATDIVTNYGFANVIVAANVICHLPDLADLMRGISKLLHSEGTFIFEEPYLGSMIELVSFDQIYDEHVFIFSLISVSNICNEFGLELYDAIKQPTHGGSMRYFVSHKGKRTKSERLVNLLKSENAKGLDKLQTYLDFQINCELKKTKLNSLIASIKQHGKSIGGYAATSKSTTILNYCGIDSDSIDFICDSTPEKMNTFAPGTNIPIVSVDFMHANQPDYLLLFAWNHEHEIMEKEKNLLNDSVQWIKFVPEVGIV